MEKVLALVLLVSVLTVYGSLDKPPHHHKPFGWGNAKQAEEVQGFLPVTKFFEGMWRAGIFFLCIE